MQKKCEELKECREAVEQRINEVEDMVHQIISDVKETKENSQAIREMLDTYNNGKSIFNAIRIMSKIAVWLAATGAALTAIYHAITHFGR